MAKRRILVVVASRANYARVKSVMHAVREHPDLELQVIVSASALLERFGSAVDVISADGFNVDASVFAVVEGENPTTMAKSTGLAILELATQFQNLKPDLVLTVADRYETMATAVTASYMNIPLAHTQGGEVTGSIDESVRHAITKLAHLHFVTTPLSRERVLNMGEDPRWVFQVGCPSVDLAAGLDMDRSGLLKRYGGVGPKLGFDKPYLVVMQHPVTTEYGRAFQQVNETLQAIEDLRMPTFWFWPNIDAGSDDISKGLRVFREQQKPDYVHFYRNMAPEDFLRLMNGAACMVGNSSSAIREGSYLGIPAVNVGSRQDRRERGSNIVDVGFDRHEIASAIRKQVAHGRYPASTLYGDGKAGARIAEILAGPLPSVQKRLTY